MAFMASLLVSGSCVFVRGSMTLCLWLGNRCGMSVGSGFFTLLEGSQSPVLLWSFPVSALPLTYWYLIQWLDLWSLPRVPVQGAPALVSIVLLLLIMLNVACLLLSAVSLLWIAPLIRRGAPQQQRATRDAALARQEEAARRKVAEEAAHCSCPLARRCFEADGRSVGGCCAVCLQEYQAGEELLELTCRHVYHSHCLRRWLGGGQGCPMRCAA